jgi:hypothetical protein
VARGSERRNNPPGQRAEMFPDESCCNRRSSVGDELSAVARGRSPGAARPRRRKDKRLSCRTRAPRMPRGAHADGAAQVAAPNEPPPVSGRNQDLRDRVTRLDNPVGGAAVNSAAGVQGCLPFSGRLGTASRALDSGISAPCRSRSVRGKSRACVCVTTLPRLEHPRHRRRTSIRPGCEALEGAAPCAGRAVGSAGVRDRRARDPRERARG